MFRKGLLLAVTLLVVAGSVADAQAQSPISLRISGLVGLRTAEVAVSFPAIADYSIDESVQAFGAELGIGLPMGIYGAVHYLRHVKDIKEVSTDNIDLGANEIGVNLEKHFGFLPGSPIAPYLGVGAGYARVSFGDELKFSNDAPAFDASVNIIDLYGVAGMKLAGIIGANLRLGYSTGDVNEEFDIAGQTLKVGMDYSGTFATLGLSVGF